jgi:hypothetical protein
VALAGRGKKGKAAEDVNYVPASDIQVRMDGKPATLDALPAGTKVTLRLSADRKQVLAIWTGRTADERKK